MKPANTTDPAKPAEVVATAVLVQTPNPALAPESTEQLPRRTRRATTRQVYDYNTYAPAPQHQMLAKRKAAVSTDALYRRSMGKASHKREKIHFNNEQRTFLYKPNVGLPCLKDFVN